MYWNLINLVSAMTRLAKRLSVVTEGNCIVALSAWDIAKYPYLPLYIAAVRIKENTKQKFIRQCQRRHIESELTKTQSLLVAWELIKNVKRNVCMV